MFINELAAADDMLLKRKEMTDVGSGSPNDYLKRQALNRRK